MGQFYAEIPPSISEWILRQKIMFVASAPLSGTGHVNVSPKEVEGCFFIESSTKVWYQDLTGSGVETICHMNEEGNGRMTIMFVAFEGGPRILRLFGKGTVHERTTPGYRKYLPEGSPLILPGSRAVIELDIHRVGSSCGFSIPYFEYLKPRPTLSNWVQKRMLVDLPSSASTHPDPSEPQSTDSPDPRSTDLLFTGPTQPLGLREYWVTRNSTGMDGLPGLRVLGDGETVDPSKVDMVGVDGVVQSGGMMGIGVGRGKAVGVKGVKGRQGWGLGWAEWRVVLALVVGVVMGVWGGEVGRAAMREMGRRWGVGV